ncbi:MAG: hypothetical protein QG630_171 [Patescibacteria group bacterium]|nr:hypothetical protein [Patescibacteria group bacterium]
MEFYKDPILALLAIAFVVGMLSRITKKHMDQKRKEEKNL